MRTLLLLAALLLLAPAAVAGAQTATPSPTPVATEDPVDDEAPIDDDAPAGGPCDASGTDADYDYCAYAPGAGEGSPSTPKPEPGGAVPTVATAQPLPQSTLPYTGASPLVVALLGLALVLVGLGGRRMTAPSRSAVRSRAERSGREVCHVGGPCDSWSDAPLPSLTR